jgi:uncharacterized membrane protein
MMRVLLAGESWTTDATHVKGFDKFTSVTFHLGASEWVKALEGGGIKVAYMPAHVAASDFPLTLREAKRYDAIVLSDIGSNTLVLHPDVWLHGRPVPNRLKLLRDYVRGGGGLVMVGGYYSFQGIKGGARYPRTPVEEVLPVSIRETDDRLEVPEGFAAEITAAGKRHPILAGIGGRWPLLLGLNEVTAKPDATVLARLPKDQGGHPLLAAWDCGKGRSVAWASDIGPHWLPTRFAEWKGFARLFRQMLRWVARA